MAHFISGQRYHFTIWVGEKGQSTSHNLTAFFVRDENWRVRIQKEGTGEWQEVWADTDSDRKAGPDSEVMAVGWLKDKGLI